jgi:hypothetical protein
LSKKENYVRYYFFCCFILFYFVLFCFILFYFVLFYFILFCFVLFYFILFYFILKLRLFFIKCETKFAVATVERDEFKKKVEELDYLLNAKKNAIIELKV